MLSGLLTVASLLTDIGIGMIAYRLAVSNEKNQAVMSELLKQLVSRVEKLEAR